MEIVIKDIPAGGLDLKVDSKTDPWFLNVLKESLAVFYQTQNNGSARFQIYRTGDNVLCTGQLLCDCYPTCSRCLKVFRHHLEIPIRQTLVPLYESPRQLEIEQKEEVELVKEDLDFAFYEGDRFNLASILREQIILELPMQPVCSENCKGLCSQCGKDLNEGTCHCQPPSPDLKWTPLKSWKKK